MSSIYRSVAIEDFCFTGSGGTPSRANASFYQGHIPWVKSGELRECVILKTEENITEEAINESSAKMVPSGAILMAMYGATVGRLALLGIDAATNQAICNIRPDRNVADTGFVYRALEAKVPELISKAAGGAQPNISQDTIRKTRVFLPPLDEQKRIAAILDKADALRRQRRQALALLDSLTQSIFLEMFGDLIENAKSFPAGRISDWVADFETGKNLAPDRDNSEPLSNRVLKVSAVTSGRFNPEESKPLPMKYVVPSHHFVRFGDLLFSRANTSELIGATALVSQQCERLVLPDKIWRFIWKGENPPNPVFIHGLFSSAPFRAALSKRATGTSGSMKNISKKKVLGIACGIPTRGLQDEFAHKVNKLGQARDFCEQQLSAIETGFASLQHRAFSGQL